MKRVCHSIVSRWVSFVVLATVLGCALDAAAALPSPWVQGDIGPVGVKGTANESAGVITVQGSGTDIWNGTDQFTFVYQSLSGDGEIVARVTAVQNTNAEAKAGVMLRESLAPGARHVSMFLTSGKGTLFVFRPAANGSVGYGFAPATAPRWVKVARKGTTITAFHSANGTTWTQAGQFSLSGVQNVYVGLAVNSKNNTVLNTSTFDNVRVTNGTAPPPSPNPNPTPTPSPTVTLSSLALNPASVTSGASAQGTVTLSAAAPSGGAVVTLSSSQPSVATVPSSVTIAAGSTTATFTVTTAAVSSTAATNIGALYGGVTKIATLNVSPKAVVTLTSLSVTPASVQGGTQCQGRATLSAAAPAGGATVTLSSSGSAATIPANVTVPAGSTSAAFAIGTTTVSSATTVNIAGAYAGATLSASLTIGAANSVTGFYVAPNGSPSGDGSINRPWNLQTALAHPAAVKPGNTIWLRGGTYRGNFKSTLTGTAAAPIIVRQYPGERATIDANTSIVDAAIRVHGADTWYWGFEVTNSNPNRNNSGGFNNPPLRATSVYVVGPRTKFINLVVHDGLEGFDFWSPAVDAEIYGTLVYNVGVESPDRGHGHSIYVQNKTGTKRITDNILFNGYSFGIHAYTGSDGLDNIRMEGNVVFNHGVLSDTSGAKANIYFGGGDVPDNPTLINNYVYSTPGNDGRAADLDNAGGCRNLTLTGNYLVGDSALEIAGCTVSALTGNTFYGRAGSQVAGNTYHTNRPAGVKAYVRPNRHEPGRANIVVYNWDALAFVGVDVSSVLKNGQAYEVRNAQDFFAAPVLSGTYDGRPLSLPMNGLSVARPIGGSAPPPTGPDFNVFVLIPR
jgi:hypothetical protein